MIQITKKLLILGTLTLVLTTCQPATEDAKPMAENVILIIGDGMGLSQVSTAFHLQEDSTHFWRFPVIGLSETSSTSKITDSAAGATAFSAGLTTYNGAIGVNSDTMEVETIMELLSKKGWQTGLVATSSIQHATPASFYAHVKSRRMYETISEQLVSSDVDFFAGGGIKFFAKRSDSVNWLTNLEEAGFVWDTTSLKADLDPGKKYGFLLAADGMPPAQLPPESEMEGRGSFLTDASKIGIEYLEQSGKPFFIMIEGSQIDWAGHANRADYMLMEMMDFDQLLGWVLDYAEKDGNTLVVVTADHETGGYTLSSGENYDEINPTFSTGGHSATLVPVFAYGPGAENFAGVYKNTQIYWKMLESIKTKE